MSGSWVSIRDALMLSWSQQSQTLKRGLRLSGGLSVCDGTTSQYLSSRLQSLKLDGRSIRYL